MSDFQKLTRGENPLFAFNNKDILAVGNPDGTKLKNTFTPENVRLTDEAEKKMFKEEGLDDSINPNDFYTGGIAHKKRSKKRHTSRKTNKRRSSKKRKSRRSNKKKSK